MEWYHVWWPWLTSKFVARLSAIAEFLVGAKDEGSDGDNWNCAKLQSNQHPTFLQADAASCRSTNNVKALKGNLPREMRTEVILHRIMFTMFVFWYNNRQTEYKQSKHTSMTSVRIAFSK